MSFSMLVHKLFPSEKVPRVLDHITDVGSSQFEGSDSLYRIRQQYQSVNVQNPFIVPAGHSPLHVAFCGTTCLSHKARENAHWLLQAILGIQQKKRLPIALNSAPRNNSKLLENGKEDNIFHVRVQSPYADYLVYGLQVVEWLKVFHVVESVERIVSIKEIIEDTSHGSQFRSAEHLPLVHVLSALGELEKHAFTEIIDLSTLADRTPEQDKAIIAPFDEYENGRIIVHKKTMESLLQFPYCSIPELSDTPFSVHTSLTKVASGELSVWPSSNHFPNPNIAVMNIGTRWAEGATYNTYDASKELTKTLSQKNAETLSILPIHNPK